MIRTKKDLHSYLDDDSRNFICHNRDFTMKMKALYLDPICDQRYIWKYIYSLRHLEYHINNNGTLHKIFRIYYLYLLRRYAYKTGFQIPPNVCDAGITIWHWGPIIVNQNVHIGKNVTLYPGVLIGWKSPNLPCPVIGDNVFIGSGVKIIGDLHIGDNVIIGQNCVITKSIEANSVVVSSKNRILD